MDIMQHYALITDFLGQVLTDNYEIALLDLREDKKFITAIANGKNSGRSVGAPLTDLARKIIQEGIWKNEHYLINYSGLTKDQKPLISSTLFIKEAGKLVGMFCINVDIQVYIDLSNSILKLGKLPSSPVEIVPEHIETFTNDISDIISSALPLYIRENNIPTERLTQEEKIAVVKQLSDNGIFLIKGAVSEVALKLNCSEATIYRYVSKIGKSDKKA
jgi:Uncharacterized protein conserved in bacteria